MKLKASSAGGICFNDTTINVVVNAMPISNFGLVDVCTNDAVSFFDSSTIGNGSIISYAWDFGDAPPSGTSSQQNPIYKYGVAGTFIVVLTVTSDSGCVDVQGKSIEVFPLPAASFTFADVCLYDAAICTNTSTIASGSIDAWQWDFGDVSTSTSESPTHTYGTDGPYNVTLIVISDNSCSDTIVQPIVIFPVPVAAYNTAKVCLYDPAVFTDASTIAGGNIVGWNWDFDDGGTSSVQSPNYSYSADGTYNVSLIAVSDNGCVDTLPQTLVIFPVPVAGVITSNECLNDPANFTDATTINSPGTWTTWLWDFGDGSGTSALPNPSYTYAVSDTFNVTLTITSDDGCIDDTTISVIIYPLPLVTFIADTLSGCEVLCVTFTNNTTISSGSISTWAWDFDDGNTSATQNPRNCFTAIDENTVRTSYVTLIATSAFGCSETNLVPLPINIWPKPIGIFTVVPQPTTILAPVIDFSDASQGGIASWEWNFGDADTLFGIDSAAANPAHLYADTGTYLVRQIVSNQYACRDTSFNPLIIDPGSIMHIPNSFTPNGDGINDGFFPQGIGFDAVKFEMRIYDRWGDMIYKTDDASLPWLGTANNGRKVVQTDVYIWMILATNMQGEKHTSIGHVTLLR